MVGSRRLRSAVTLLRQHCTWRYRSWLYYSGDCMINFVQEYQMIGPWITPASSDRGLKHPGTQSTPLVMGTWLARPRLAGDQSKSFCLPLGLSQFQSSLLECGYHKPLETLKTYNITYRSTDNQQPRDVTALNIVILGGFLRRHGRLADTSQGCPAEKDGQDYSRVTIWPTAHHFWFSVGTPSYRSKNHTKRPMDSFIPSSRKAPKQYHPALWGLGRDLSLPRIENIKEKMVSDTELYTSIL